MRTALDPFSFVVTSVAGWMNQHHHQVITYLTEENRLLHEQIGARRIRFSDDRRRRPVTKAKKLGRRVLGEVVTSGTLLAWHRKVTSIVGMGIRAEFRQALNFSGKLILSSEHSRNSKTSRSFPLLPFSLYNKHYRTYL